MYRLLELWARFVGTVLGRRRDADLDREMTHHLELAVEDGVARGLSREDARAAAVRDLGGVMQTKERFREQLAFSLVHDVGRDVRYAWRAIAARRLAAAVTMLTIALGVGANAAVFAVAYGVVWRPLAYNEAHRLVRLYFGKADAPEMPVSPPNYLDWREMLRSTEAVAAWRSWTFEVRRDDGAESTPGAQVTASMFDVLRIQPVVGRRFLETEDTPGGQRVAVISHRWWQSHFGGDPAVVGRSFTSGDSVFTIVGVLPPGQSFPNDDVAIWTPLRIGDPTHRMRRSENYLNVVARLAHATSLDAAQQDADRIAGVLAVAHPESNARTTLTVRSLHDVVTSSAREPLMLLTAVAVMLLLISCANVAYLLVSRTDARHRELEVRAALGATRLRLVRQLGIETLLIVGAGTIAGVGAAYVSLQQLLPMLPASVPRQHEIRLDSSVIGYVLLCSTLVWLVSVVVPGVRVWGGHVKGLTVTTRIAGRPLTVADRFAVVVQVSLSAAMLVVALLVLQSLRAVLSQDAGFSSRGLMATEVSHPTPDMGSATTAFFETLVSEAQRVPGVAAAGLVNHLPLGADSASTRLTIDNRATRPEDVQMVRYRVVSPTYFQAMRARLVRGRFFADADRAGASLVFVVNEAMVRRFWGLADPIGRRVRRGGLESKMSPGTVVGVVADMKQDSLDGQVQPELFIPHAQFPWPTMQLLIRTEALPGGVASDVRALVARSTGAAPRSPVRPIEDIVWTSVGSRAFASTLLALLTGLALAVATLGVYAVASHVTAAKTKELAIRLALGAPSRSAVDVAIGHTMRLVLIGLLLGAMAGAGASQLVSSMLFEVTAYDPLTHAGTFAVLAMVGFLAAAGPARRATRVSPVIALRAD
jgi:putative ABC transport system permease protein